MVRLRSEKDLPTNHPDTDYPAGYMFLNETTVNDASIERPLQGPYIAGQCIYKGEFSQLLLLFSFFTVPVPSPLFFFFIFPFLCSLIFFSLSLFS